MREGGRLGEEEKVKEEGVVGGEYNAGRGSDTSSLIWSQLYCMESISGSADQVGVCSNEQMKCTAFD